VDGLHGAASQILRSRLWSYSHYPLHPENPLPSKIRGLGRIFAGTDGRRLGLRDQRGRWAAHRSVYQSFSLLMTTSLRLLSGLLLLCLAGFTSAQAQGVMTFEKELHDFGSVPEGTMATHEFTFKNTGNQPVIIAGVQASCGCTTPEWTKAPVLPGKVGVVKAMYSSAGRPGIFNKTITVTSNAATPSTVLTIKGNVLNKEDIRKTLTPAQLAASPQAVSPLPVHNFGHLEVGQQVGARFIVKNTGKQDWVPGTISSACFCIGYKSTPTPIKAGESGTLELVYSPRRPGTMLEDATISSNDLHGDLKLTLKAEVVKSLNAASLVKESDVSVPFK